MEDLLTGRYYKFYSFPPCGSYLGSLSKIINDGSNSETGEWKSFPYVFIAHLWYKNKCKPENMLLRSTGVMSNNLYDHPLYRVKVELLSSNERVSLAYARAKLVIETYDLSLSDIQHCTQKFWDMMTDPILCLDAAVATILVAHVNLTIGSLSRHVENRPDLKPLVDSLLRYDVVGVYLLTERGHGLDSLHIETTANKTADGFILHTPREEAAKFMPASTSSFGIRKVGMVMAKLIVDGEDRGSRFFMVPICDEHKMHKGVSSVRLPPRSGTSPLDFAVTSFNHVHLPPTAIVASDIHDLSIPKQPLIAWWDEVWRIKLGTVTVSGPWIAALKAVTYIGGKYSMHRCITGKDLSPIPIMSFRTQQLPITRGIAVSIVMDNWYFTMTKQIATAKMDPRVRHALSVILKATVVRHFQRSVAEISERCGAQGTFEANLMARFENDVKGAVIADGDILTLCTRLFSELVLAKYEFALPRPTESLLAHHAFSLIAEERQLVTSFGTQRYSDAFNNLTLPQSQIAVEAIGQAMAFSAAKQANLPQTILDMYECTAIRQDSAWYSDVGGISRMDQRVREDKAVTAMIPQLSEYLDGLGIENYVSAPIVSDEKWKQYLEELPVCAGNAASDGVMRLRAAL